VADASASRWDEIRARKLTNPTVQERYERTRDTVATTRRVLQAIDTERKKAGLAKKELAELVGTNPSAIRRLLTSGSSNPTLRTLLEVLDVLGLELTLRPKRARRASREIRGSRQRAESTMAAAG
jgi:ribosome-binding protein aMBF1 (putative translation factor)